MEMERDSLITHGAKESLRERMMLSSDAFKTVFCRKCGRTARHKITEVKEKSRRFTCKKCGPNAEFGQITIPCISKLFQNTLNIAGYDLFYTFKPDETKFKSEKDQPK